MMLEDIYFIASIFEFSHPHNAIIVIWSLISLSLNGFTLLLGHLKSISDHDVNNRWVASANRSCWQIRFIEPNSLKRLYADLRQNSGELRQNLVKSVTTQEGEICKKIHAYRFVKCSAKETFAYSENLEAARAVEERRGRESFQLGSVVHYDEVRIILNLI